MNIVFVTMMYGVAIPLLFPIAVLSLFILYSLERVLLAYYYKPPPCFSGEMNESAIYMMMIAVPLNLFFGYWILSNQQMFYNRLEKKASADAIPHTHHYLSTSLENDHSLPLFIAGVILTIVASVFIILRGFEIKVQ